MTDSYATCHYTLKLFPLTKNTYRRFCWSWWKEYLNPKTYWKTVKYFCQRGYRGYADCDSWDTDSYLESVILGLIKDLKKYTHGYPSYLSDYSFEEDQTESSLPDTGYQKWQAILQMIIEGLEAAHELQLEDTVPPGTYSDEPVEFEEVPGSEGKLFTIKEPLNGPRFNKELYNQWEAPLLKKKKKAMLLLVKHWGSFWD